MTTGTVQDFDLQPDPRILPMLGEINLAQWRCLAELVDNSVDGFLSAGRRGSAVVDPHIGVNFLTFPTQDAAQQFADAMVPRNNVSDRPERVCEQNFRVRVYKHDDGTEILLYAGSDPLQIRTCYLLALGLVQAAKMNAKVVIEARPLTIYHPLQNALIPTVTP